MPPTVIIMKLISEDYKRRRSSFASLSEIKPFEVAFGCISDVSLFTSK